MSRHQCALCGNELTVVGSLHEKLDQVLHTQLEQLVDMHRSQLALLQQLVERTTPLAGTLQR